MRENFVSFTPSHLAILVTNHLPAVHGDDPAIWRRIRVVPFDVVIPDDQQDTELNTKLELEADGILSWAVTGWADYHQHGLNDPDTVRTATNAYQQRSDDIGRFITEQCHTGTLFRATTTVLHNAYQHWQETDGQAHPMGRGAFGEALQRRGYPTQQPDRGKRWRTGIALKDNNDDE